MSERSINELEAQVARLRSENLRLRQENEELRSKLGSAARSASSDVDDAIQPPRITNQAGVEKKIQLFRSLFRGRDPIRWENRQGRAGYSPACGNEWHKTLCGKPRIKCGAFQNADFLAVTDRVIHDHLIGKHTIGVYPILADESCWFLAIDFDKATW